MLEVDPVPMVTNKRYTAATLAGLLDRWQRLLLRDHQRAMFLIWLRDHTKIEIHHESFPEQLGAWLLSIEDPQVLYSEVLVIHAEILWSSNVPLT